MSRFDECLLFTLHEEGGYANVVGDAGGPTNCGVTQIVYDEWCHSKARRTGDVKNITHDEVMEIYRDLYWSAYGCGMFAAPLDLVMFDSVVNFSARRVVKWLQALVGTDQDGLVGSRTIAAAKTFPTRDLAIRMVQKRIDRRHERVVEKPDQLQFLRGWLARDQHLLDRVKSSS